MRMHCFVGDLLGFRNLILNLSPEKQVQRVDQWLKLTKDAAAFAKIERYQLISDTIFAGAEDTAQGLQQLIEFSQFLLQEGTKLALPIRGAITLGDINWDKEITFGKAITNAYELGNNQNWIGVCCEPGLEHYSPLLLSWDKLVIYPVPFKHGEIKLVPAIAWAIPPIADLTKMLTGGGLTKENEKLNWDWATKLQNTILFRIYLRTNAPYRHHLSPEFRGTLPVELVDHIADGGLYLRLRDNDDSSTDRLVRMTLGCPPGGDCATRDLPVPPKNI